MPHRFTALAVLFALVLSAPAIGHSGPDHDNDHKARQQPKDDDASSQSPTAKAPAAPPKAARKSPGKGKDPHAPVTAYKKDQLLGWNLLVHEDLLADKQLHKQFMDELHHQLFRITRVIPAEKVKLLQKVPVWVELRNPYSRNCQYHPSGRWLKANGYLPQKAKAVEIGDARSFINTSQRSQPFVMLHELAHAYHDQHLNFNHPKVVDAYKKAKASGGYDKVLHMVGRKVRAYAMADHKEYFAESTEAYFGTNDHYPFVRPELKAHDPVMYNLLRELWGVKR